MIKKGDLIKFRSTGRYATVTRGTYNFRDIDPDCPQSIAIVNAFDVVMMDDGRERRIRKSRAKFDVISSKEVS